MRVVPLFALSGCSLLVPHLTTPGLDSSGSNDSGGCPAWQAPSNRYPQGVPPDCLVATGFHVGETVPDFRLPDQNAETDSLWQFYGDVIVLDISTGWCGPCQKLAATAQQTQDDYDAKGFMYVTVMPQNVSGAPPAQGDLQAWADYFKFTSLPVIADDATASYTTAPIAQSGGTYPFVEVIGRDMKASAIVQVDPTTPDINLRAAIDAIIDE